MGESLTFLFFYAKIASYFQNIIRKREVGRMSGGSHAIKNGNTKVTVLKAGGTVKRFSVGRKNIFYPFRMINGKQRGGCFFCAPWFGSSPRAEKKHGFLRDYMANWSCVGVNGGQFVFYEKKEENYPWAVRYMTGALLDEKRTLRMFLKITRGNDDMLRKAPVLPGFHPFFACEDASKVKVFTGGKKYQGFKEKSKMIPLKEKYIHIVIPGKKEIEMTLGGDFFEHAQPQMVLWTDSPEEYFCVEPILQDQKLFETSKGFYLDKRENIYLEVSFRAL